MTSHKMIRTRGVAKQDSAEGKQSADAKQLAVLAFKVIITVLGGILKNSFYKTTPKIIFLIQP